ncbi:hypothetical protein B0H13DRAFT_2070434 [Mycena leptocephala]|nr:hypothetical protein B0H13DRAFT_2070434 [Mycena leptocephala]
MDPPGAHHHHFIDCPGEGCDERIPSVLVCSGSNVPWHKDLRYRVCSDCRYFKWLDPDLFEAAERRAQDAPANGAPPYPPLPPPPPFYNPGSSFPLDPALQSPVLPTFSPPAASQPFTSSQSSKPKCSAGCSRVAGARDCSWKRCKTCCERQGKGCRYSGHRKQRHGPASAPARTWAQRYIANHQEREARKTAEEQRRKQDLLFERQVQVCCWTKNGEEPEWGRKQGLLTYPKVNIADHPSLLRKLDLLATDEVYIYDFDGGCFHREDVDYVMLVPSRQVILARHLGVTDCPTSTSTSRSTGRGSCPSQGPVDEHFPRNGKQTRLFFRPVSRLRVLCPRARTSRGPAPPILVFFAGLTNASGLSILSNTASSPSTRPSSPLPSTRPSLPLPVSNQAADPDIVLLAGPWPEGVYARDMAAAIGKIAPKTSSAFGREFPKGAWYQNLKAWKLSEQHERDAAAQLPRSAAGLWTVWRATSMGWAKVCADKKH